MMPSPFPDPVPAPRHFAFLIRSLAIGGAERQLVALANGLATRGHRISLLLLYAEGDLLADLDPRVDIVDLGKRHRYDLVRFLRRFTGALTRLRPDLLYSWLQVPNLMSGLATWLPSAPAVAWSVRGTDIDPDSYDLARRLVDAAVLRISHRPAVIIANAEATRRELVTHGVAVSRIAVVPNGIDLTRFRPDPEARERIRREFGVQEAAPIIGMVARLDPMKDHATLLAAAALFLPAHPAARLVVVGDGPDTLRCELFARAEVAGIGGRIIWTGLRHDLPALYGGFDLCTLSSRFGEAFPNVLGEAMACGVPCVATDIGDSAELIGPCGRIVPPEAPMALAEAWQDLLARPAEDRRQLGIKARARIAALFGLDRMITASETALIGAISGNRRRL
jgi:glycosyltransferase involved in cell wall biosynthesis